MIPFVRKMSPQRGHGSTHSITEIGTGMVARSSNHLLRKRRLRALDLPYAAEVLEALVGRVQPLLHRKAKGPKEAAVHQTHPHVEGIHSWGLPR